MLQWKVVETSSVTDESLQAILNDWTSQGWTFEGMQFAMRESSKRPAMAFVLFTKDAEEPATGGARTRGALEEPASPATGGARTRGALEEPASPATGGARTRGALEEGG